MTGKQHHGSGKQQCGRQGVSLPCLLWTKQAAAAALRQTAVFSYFYQIRWRSHLRAGLRNGT